METLCDAVDIINSHVVTRESVVMENKGDNHGDMNTGVSREGDVLCLDPSVSDVVIKEELIDDDNNSTSLYEVQTSDGEIQQVIQYIQIENLPTASPTTAQAELCGQDIEMCEINMSDLKNITDGTQILQVLYVPQNLNQDSTAGDSSCKCLICSKVFDTVDMLKAHMNTHNPRPHFRELRAIMTQTDESAFQSKLPFSQSDQSEIVVSDGQVNSVNSDSIFSSVNSSLGGVKYTQKAALKSNTCQICSKTFVSASKLMRHSYLHTGEKPFECKICHRRFTQIAHLKVHEEVHTGQYVYRKLYPCSYCGKRFSSKSNIQTHLVIHTGVKAYKCQQCGKCFALPAHLKRHEFSHTGLKPFTCTVCMKSFTTKCSMVIHSRQHSGERPFSCDTCGRSFYDKTHLRRHLKLHKRMYKCSKCQSHFANILKLNSHLKTHEPVNDSVQTTEDVVKLVESIKKSTNKSSVPKVRKYRTRHPLSPSLPVVHLPPEEQDATLEDFTLDLFSADNVVKHETMHGYSLKSKAGDDKEVKNRCNQCGKGFAHPSNLLKHKKTVHTTVRQYKCDVCQRSFTQNAHLKVHKQTLHPDPGEKVLYQCGVCFRQFNVQKNAERHMKHVHLGQEQKKMFQCKLCDKQFAFPVQLKRHLKKHEDETSRQCNQCDKTFTSLWHFNMHHRTHTGEKPYECDICLLKFGDKSTLTRHKKAAHEKVSRVTCGVCKKTFSSKGHLVKHLKRHPETRHAVLMAEGNAKECGANKESPPFAAGQKYQCGECQEEFTYFANAFAHMKVHAENGEVPLKCPFCEADFSEMNAMKKHIREHTGEPEPKRRQVCNFCNRKFFKRKTLKAHLEKMHSRVKDDKSPVQIKLEPGLESQSSPSHSELGITTVVLNENGERIKHEEVAQTLPFYSTAQGMDDRSSQLTFDILKQEQGVEDEIITVVLMDPAAVPQDEQVEQHQMLETEAAKVLHSLNSSKAQVIELAVTTELDGVQAKQLESSTDN